MMKLHLDRRVAYLTLALALLVLASVWYFVFSSTQQDIEKTGTQVSFHLPLGNYESKLAPRQSQLRVQESLGDTERIGGGVSLGEEDELLKMLANPEERTRYEEQWYREAEKRVRQRKMEKQGLPTDRSKAILAIAQEADVEQLIWTIAPTGANDEHASRAAWALAIVLFRNPALLKRLEELLLSGALALEHSRRLIDVIGSVPGNESVSLLLRLMDSMPTSLLGSLVQALAAVGTTDRTDTPLSPEERVLWFDDRQKNTPFFPMPRAGRLPVDGRVLDAYIKISEREELDYDTESLLASMMSMALTSLVLPGAEPKNLRIPRTDYIALLTEFLLKRYHAANTVEEQLACCGDLEASPLPEVTELFVSFLSDSDPRLLRCGIFALANRGVVNGDLEDRILRVAQSDTCLEVRLAAAEALVSDGRFGANKVQLLVDLYSLAETESLRANIVLKLGQTNADAFPHLERIALKDPSERVRQGAVKQAEILRRELCPPPEEREEEDPDQ